MNSKSNSYIVSPSYFGRSFARPATISDSSVKSFDSVLPLMSILGEPVRRVWITFSNRGKSRISIDYRLIVLGEALQAGPLQTAISTWNLLNGDAQYEVEIE